MQQLDIFETLEPPFKLGKKINLFEAFSGYGSQQMALKRLGCEVNVIGYSEIDKYAIKVYEKLHGKHHNYGAIGTFERLPNNIDICTWSFPCQDISLAGKQQGMVDGSRSNYGYVFLDTVERTPLNERPKVLLMENVRALISEKFKDDWREIQTRLERLGYTNYAEVLNSKDYGVAQNRERVFIVSILRGGYYKFPKPYKLTKRLKDYLEDDVDEKYFLSEKQLDNVVEATFTDSSEALCINSKINGKQPSQQDRIYHENGIAVAITTCFQPSIAIKEAGKKGYSIAKDGDGIYIDRPHQKRGVVQNGMVPTIKTQGHDLGVVVKSTDKRLNQALTKITDNETKIIDTYNQTFHKEATPTIKTTLNNSNTTFLHHNLRIRKLTPREALRLMDVSEKDIDTILLNVSESQAYKLAGNSIVVNVLVKIFEEIIEEKSL